MQAIYCNLWQFILYLFKLYSNDVSVLAAVLPIRGIQCDPMPSYAIVCHRMLCYGMPFHGIQRQTGVVVPFNWLPEPSDPTEPNRAQLSPTLVPLLWSRRQNFFHNNNTFDYNILSILILYSILMTDSNFYSLSLTSLAHKKRSESDIALGSRMEFSSVTQMLYILSNDKNFVDLCSIRLRFY